MTRVLKSFLFGGGPVTAVVNTDTDTACDQRVDRIALLICAFPRRFVSLVVERFPRA